MPSDSDPRCIRSTYRCHRAGVWPSATYLEHATRWLVAFTLMDANAVGRHANRATLTLSVPECMCEWPPRLTVTIEMEEGDRPADEYDRLMATLLPQIAAVAFRV